MRKKDLLLIGAILLAALAAFAAYYFILPRGDSTALEITVNGEVYGTYNLSENQTIEINDTNTCIIKSGKVRMASSRCPDHLCEKQKSIDSRGGTIVCLPNRTVLSIARGSGGAYDAVT